RIYSVYWFNFVFNFERRLCEHFDSHTCVCCFSYCVAVGNDHVTAFWPYISDSGTLPPESCIFGQLLNLAALFLAITVYLRHRQIVEFYWHRLKQENNVIIVHYAGALLAFGCGLIYTWAQTVFSYNMNPKLAKPIVSHCRLMLCVISTMFFITMIVFGPILGKQPNSFVPDAEGHLYKWTVDSPNYIEHMIGTCSEWLLAICFQLYILSFAIELRHAYCHAPKLRLMPFYDDFDTNGCVTNEKSIGCDDLQTIESNKSLSKKVNKISDSCSKQETMVVRIKF
ncbi:DNA damage-regulated autophagy modulator protein 2, partial [Toxocara canis]